MVILLQFNTVNSLNAHELLCACELPYDKFFQQLNILVYYNVLKRQRPSSWYTLKYSYSATYFHRRQIDLDEIISIGSGNSTPRSLYQRVCPRYCGVCKHELTLGKQCDHRNPSKISVDSAEMPKKR